jgi:pimeloyl-ACP methyl ester carboxylesterase
MFRTAPRAALRTLLAGDAGSRWTEPSLARPLEPPAALRLGEVRAQALVVVGERDLPDFRAIAAVLAAGIPGARAVTLPDVGHLTPLEAPALLADTLREFLLDAAV